jgi:hypothetical protein
MKKRKKQKKKRERRENRGGVWDGVFTLVPGPSPPGTNVHISTGFQNRY